MDTPPQHRPRIGTFFILVGTFLLILFLGSGFSQQPQFLFFFLAVAAFVIGYLFRRGTPARPSSGRFGMIQKARDRSRMRKEERKKKD